VSMQTVPTRRCGIPCGVKTRGRALFLLIGGIALMALISLLWAATGTLFWFFGLLGVVVTAIGCRSLRIRRWEHPEAAMDDTCPLPVA